MKKLLPFLALAFLLFAGVASAATADFYRRTSVIDMKETEVEDTILFKGAPSKLSIPLFYSATDFESTSTLGDHNCELREKDYGSLIYCRLPKDKEGRLTLRFRARELTKKIGSHFYFEDSLKVPLDTNKIVYTAELKSGLVLIPKNSSSAFSQYSPKSGEKGSDGRRIFVYWTKKNIEEGGGVSPSLSFERSRRVGGTSTDIYALLAGLSILIILVVAAIKSGSEGERELPLKEDEREVMEIVEGPAGEVKQKRIVDATDFSKAKVSRLVKDLKDRDLIEVEKVGRTNRLTVKEEGD